MNRALKSNFNWVLYFATTGMSLRSTSVQCQLSHPLKSLELSWVPVQWEWYSGFKCQGFLLESNLAVVTAFKAQELYITSSTTRNNREGHLVWVVTKPGGTANIFCTAYFQIGFGPVFAPVLRAFWKCTDASNRHASSESNWAKWPEQEIYGHDSYVSAYLDSQDSKTTGQLSAISAPLMHLSQYRQGKMEP